MISPSISIFSSLPIGDGQGSAGRATLPSNVALPGPSLRKLSTAFWRSSLANSSANWSGVIWSASSTPPSR